MLPICGDEQYMRDEPSPSKPIRIIITTRPAVSEFLETAGRVVVCNAPSKWCYFLVVRDRQAHHGRGVGGELDDLDFARRFFALHD